MTGAWPRADALQLAQSLQDGGPRMTDALRDRIVLALRRGWSPRMIAGACGCRVEDVAAVLEELRHER